METSKPERFIMSVTNEQQEQKLLKAQIKNIVSLQAMGKGVLARKKFAISIRY